MEVRGGARRGGGYKTGVEEVEHGEGRVRQVRIIGGLLSPRAPPRTLSTSREPAHARRGRREFPAECKVQQPLKPVVHSAKCTLQGAQCTVQGARCTVQQTNLWQGRIIYMQPSLKLAATLWW